MRVLGVVIERQLACEICGPREFSNIFTTIVKDSFWVMWVTFERTVKFSKYFEL